MSKSATYKKNASRLRNELQNRISSNKMENPPAADDPRPSGLKGREIGLWYAQRNKRKKEQELADGGESDRRPKMVSEFLSCDTN